MAPPPPPPPPPICFPFVGKKPPRRLSFSSAEPGGNPYNPSYAASQQSGYVGDTGKLTRHQSYSTTSSQSSMAYHAANGHGPPPMVPSKASSGITFLSDSEKYDEIPRDVIMDFGNGNGGVRKKNGKPKLIRGNTMTGSKKRPPPSVTTAGEADTVRSVAEVKPKSGGFASKFGYGWGIGKKNKEKERLAEIEEADPEKASIMTGSQSNLPMYQSQMSMPPPITPHRSNTRSTQNTKDTQDTLVRRDTQRTQTTMRSQVTWESRDSAESAPYQPPLTREMSGRSGNSGRSGGSRMRGGADLSRSGTGASRQTDRSGHSGADLYRSNTGVSGRSGADLSRSTTLLNRRPTLGPADSSSTLVGSAYERKIRPDESIHERVETGDRLEQLRALMASDKEKLDFYIVPSEDAHQSEYVASSDKRRQYICGFSGTSGHVIVSHSDAWLVTDSRYWGQAQRQIDSNWTLVKAGGPRQPKDWIDWLVGVIPPNSRIGIDGRMISYEKATLLNSKINSSGSKLVYPIQNLVDLVWKDKPAKSREPVFIHGTEFTGQDAAKKLATMRQWLSELPPDVPKYSSGPADPKPNQIPIATLISSLPAIAYLLNLRGSDIPYNPLFHAYLFISVDGPTVLFLDSSKVQPDVQSYLDNLGIQRRDYVDIWSFLRQREWKQEGKIVISPQTSYTIALVLTHFRTMVLPSHAEYMMSIKNPTELEGMKRAYLRDGVAFTRFLAWLESKLADGYDITEWEAAHRLTEFRRTQKHFMGLAYENISASGPNAALPHYSPRKDEAKMISRNDVYLNDSGGQYRDGTCDTTRTVHFGRPTEEQCEAYTRVLQGHIAIDTAVFPEGTSGLQLDVLARRALWKDGLNYMHGTGHGFGSFLTVHEGPQGFSSAVPLQVGHVVTNEPGYYKEGKFGMRIESALAVRKFKTRGGFNGDVWLGFERLTCVPIQTRMVKETMLTKEEKQWLKEHNQRCYEKLSPYLKDDKRAMKWLKREADRGIGLASAGPGGLAVEWD
ncbi:hypothetical protein VNI00_008460 [Paramarasmius palmivorus]|uniref:Creatinase/aminopeptidase n=1 Tax=Paramarasmius palmivorus TaxID=297713 RepID=A0AAW0CW62_9AGAR